MSVKFDKTLAIIALLLTAAGFVGHYFLPMKRVLLHPQDVNVQQLYGFHSAASGISAKWLDKDNYEWSCEYQAGDDYGCGWDIYWDPAFEKGTDFSRYEALELSLDYAGSASRIRVYMRNFNEEYSRTDDVLTPKFLSMTIPVAETKAPVLIRLSEFSVASWWLQEQNIRRQWSRPEFDNITKIGVDFIEPGNHKVKVNHIVLVGRWVRTETLLFIILGFWMAVFLLEGFVRFYLLLKKSQQERNLIKMLEDKKHTLEEEKDSLRTLADTDPLTGVYNRTGVEAHIKRAFGGDSAAIDLSLMLMDLDHFKQINDTYGHDMGDKVLKAFAAAMAANLRAEDIFARWGGEEFIVICQNKSAHALFNFAEKLREITANYTFGADFELKIHVSIGITMAYKGDAFDEVFKRADKALYKAKQGGRNRVEFEQ